MNASYGLWKMLAFVVLAECLAGSALASTVRQVTMREMIERSELVFEGKVVKAESRLSPDQSKINSYFTFEISEIIKGSYTGNTIQLSFLGGTAGDLFLIVSDMHMPELGERGIYFVESLQRRQVHPFYGWDQGHFLVIRDRDDIERVTTRNGRRVAALDAGLITKAGGLSTGIAVGVLAAGGPSEKSLTPVEFKQKLRDMIRIVAGAAE